MIHKFKNSSSRLILLDYDGTLVSFETMPYKAVPSRSLLEILRRHAEKKETDLYIVTGRMYQEIDRFLGHLPINIVAEHGAFKKEKGTWRKQIEENNEWKNKVYELLNSVTQSCPNSFIEEKHCSLAWHYRNVSNDAGIQYSRILISKLKAIIHSLNLRIIDGNKVVEIIHDSVDKGKAIQRLIELKKYDYILCMGDDKTDEDMFSFLANDKTAFTIKVGKGKTSAKHSVGSVQEAVMILEDLLA